MTETLTAEIVPFTLERAALVRARHCAEALAALLVAKATERGDPAAGPVFVDAVVAFDLDPAGTPCPASERLWELALADLVTEGVGPLEVEAMTLPGPDGRDVCQLSARLRHDMSTADLTCLTRWELHARELSALRLGDGLAYCERLAGELDQEAAPAAELSARGGEMLRAVRALEERVEQAPTGITPDGWEALAEEVDAAATRLAEAAQGAGPSVGHTLAHYVAECLALSDRAAHLLAYLDPPMPAAAGATA